MLIHHLRVEIVELMGIKKERTNQKACANAYRPLKEL
jgi:hypothetical protein